MNPHVECMVVFKFFIVFSLSCCVFSGLRYLNPLPA